MLFYLEPTGKVNTDFFNEEGNPSYKYFYSDTESVAATMIRVKNSMKSDRRMMEDLWMWNAESNFVFLWGLSIIHFDIIMCDCDISHIVTELYILKDFMFFFS